MITSGFSTVSRTRHGAPEPLLRRAVIGMDAYSSTYSFQLLYRSIWPVVAAL